LRITLNDCLSERMI